MLKFSRDGSRQRFHEGAPWSAVMWRRSPSLALSSGGPLGTCQAARSSRWCSPPNFGRETTARRFFDRTLACGVCCPGRGEFDLHGSSGQQVASTGLSRQNSLRLLVSFMGGDLLSREPQRRMMREVVPNRRSGLMGGTN